MCHEAVKLTCNTLYCPQEGILQRLQSSVEQEESRWKVKLNLSQTELKEVNTEDHSIKLNLYLYCPYNHYIIGMCGAYGHSPALSFLDERESCSTGAGCIQTE